MTGTDFAQLLQVARGELEAQSLNRSSLPGDVFVLDAPERIEGLWGSHPNVLWAQGEGFMIAGQQGSGKTTIAQQLVLRLIGVLDGPLLGLTVTPLAEGESVLYLAMDRPIQARRSFRRMVEDNPDNRQRLVSGLKTWLGPMPGDVTSAMMSDPYALSRWVQQFEGVRCVIFDSVKDIMPDLTDGKVGQAINSAWQGLLQDGVEVLALHHDRKSGSGESRTADIDAIYGSTWLTSGLGSVVKIMGDPGAEEVTLHHVKQPGEMVEAIPALHDHAAGTTTINEAERPQTVEDVLTNSARAMTTSEICAVLYGTIEKKDLQATRRRLRKAADTTGSVRLIPRGNGRAEDTWQLLQIVADATQRKA